MACALQKYFMKFIFLFLLPIILNTNKVFSIRYDCLEATNKYEQLYELPENLLLSMSLIESGRRLKNGEFVSWPWTINMKGKGKYFENKESALIFVKKHISKGKRNIDMGCMQINYMYHPKAFKNLDEAFDPEMNVKRSAELLKKLYDKFGSWKEAVGYYHSYRTSKRIKYSSKVFKKWLELKDNNQYASILEPTLTIQNISLQNQITAYDVKDKVTIKSKKQKKPTSSDKQDKKENSVNNPYLIARMEKVRFFRNYFLETRKN